MDKITLEKIAVTAFEKAQTARADLFSAAEKAIYQNMKVDDEKSSALTSGKIDGKNAEIREAQLRDILSEVYISLAALQNAERAARFAYDKAQMEVDTVKTLLRIAELP